MNGHVGREKDGDDREPVTDQVRRHITEAFKWSYLDSNLNKSTIKRHCWDNKGNKNIDQILGY